jgi:hypothetical protein
MSGEPVSNRLNPSRGQLIGLSSLPSLACLTYLEDELRLLIDVARKSVGHIAERMSEAGQLLVEFGPLGSSAAPG